VGGGRGGRSGNRNLNGTFRKTSVKSTLFALDAFSFGECRVEEGRVEHDVHAVKFWGLRTRSHKQAPYTHTTQTHTYSQVCTHECVHTRTQNGQRTCTVKRLHAICTHNTRTGVQIQVCPYTHATRMYISAGARAGCAHSCTHNTRPYTYSCRCTCTDTPLHARNMDIHIHDCAWVDAHIHARHTHTLMHTYTCMGVDLHARCT